MEHLSNTREGGRGSQNKSREGVEKENKAGEKKKWRLWYLHSAWRPLAKAKVSIFRAKLTAEV